jgi:hypothetical protein
MPKVNNPAKATGKAPALKSGANTKPAAGKLTSKLKSGTALKSSKTEKAVKAATKAKAKATKAPRFKVGDTVEFVGYVSQKEEAVFETGDRLVIVNEGKDENNQVYYACVKEEDYSDYQADAESVMGEELFATEIKKAEKLPVDEYTIQVVHIHQFDALLKEAKGDPLAAAKLAFERAAENQFLLGGALAECYKNQKFREYGEYADEEVEGKTRKGSGWNKFCQENFGLNGRKAESIMQIYQRWGAAGADLDKLATDKKIGWVKLSYAAPHVTAENRDEILAIAKTASVEEFRSTIKQDYVSAGGGTRTVAPKMKRTKLNFSLYEDAGEGVKYILETAQKKFGHSDASETLECILYQWASEHLDDKVVSSAQNRQRKILAEAKKAGVSGEELSERKASAARLENFLAGVTEEAV